MTSYNKWLVAANRIASLEKSTTFLYFRILICITSRPDKHVRIVFQFWRFLDLINDKLDETKSQLLVFNSK